MFEEKNIIELINKPLLSQSDMDKLREIIKIMEENNKITFEEGIPYYPHGEYSCAIISYNGIFKRLKVERDHVF